jgi:hypothetical protein
MDVSGQLHAVEALPSPGESAPVPIGAKLVGRQSRS